LGSFKIWSGDIILNKTLIIICASVECLVFVFQSITYENNKSENQQLEMNKYSCYLLRWSSENCNKVFFKWSVPFVSLRISKKRIKRMRLKEKINWFTFNYC